jgi:phosphoglycerate-specific signal transduction histidine kinase
MLANISVRTRLIVAMALSLLLLAAVGLSSLAALRTVDQATRDLYGRWLPSVQALSEMKYRMASHRLRFIRAMLTPDAAERRQIFATADERSDDIAGRADAFRARLKDADEAAGFTAVTTAWTRYLEEERAIRDSFDQADPVERAYRVNGPSRHAFDTVYAAVDADIAFYNKGADRSGAEAVVTFDRAMRLNLTLFVVALVLMVGFVIIVIRSISRPIERITETMHRLAEGDRTARAADRLAGSNEIGRMAAAVEVFRNYLIERDTARAALEQANEDLEEKVEARNAELIEANRHLQAEIEERIRAAETLKSMQEELVRTENLAVMGQLSAGIAHELNQPLAALSTISDNARRLMELGRVDLLDENLERISKLVERMGVLTARLRSFARRTGAERENVEIGASVDNALALIGHRLSGDALRVVLEPPAEPLWVRANAIRIEQILVNLIGNALDATRDAAEPSAIIAWGVVDGRAVLTVRDNGAGMSEETLARIFEPLFTTKKNGGGLGLGLAISADIARVFGGTLTATSAPGHGAVFTLSLPLLGDDMTAGDEVEMPAAALI